MTSKLKHRNKPSSENKTKKHEYSEVSKSTGTEFSPKQKSEKDENQETLQSAVKIDFKRIAIRCILIIGLIALMNYSQQEKFDVFASQKDEIQHKKLSLECSSDYHKDIKKYSGCVPNKCGRMITDYLISLAEVEALLIIAQKGLSLGGSSGGASILDLHSGALSQGNNFVDIYKLDKNHKAISAEDLKVYSHVKNKIKSAIVKNFGLKEDSLYLTHPTFFSRITSIPAQTVHDEYWHPHVDKETYKSFHYTSLLYLTDYGHHFEGGRFVFIDKASNITVEPRGGRLSVFTSGAENLHYVEKVTSGSRFAITVSFTCNPEYAIADPTLEGKT